MSQDSVQNNPSVGSVIVHTLGTQARNAAVGTAAGAAIGAVGGLVAPVSKNDIAYQLADKFLKSDEELIKNMGLLKKIAHSNALEQILEELKKTPDTYITVKQQKSILASLGKHGENLLKNCSEEITYKEFTGTLEQLVDEGAKKLNKEEILGQIEKIYQSVADKAKGMVETFFNKSGAQRKAADEVNDIVKLAKKCAKKAQIEKAVGSIAAIGLLAGLFAVLFDGVDFRFKKKKDSAEPVQDKQTA